MLPIGRVKIREGIGLNLTKEEVRNEGIESTSVSDGLTIVDSFDFASNTDVKIQMANLCTN